MEKKIEVFIWFSFPFSCFLGNLLAEAQTGRTISGIVVSEVGNEPPDRCKRCSERDYKRVQLRTWTDDLPLDCSGRKCFTNYVYRLSGTVIDSQAKHCNLSGYFKRRFAGFG